jgi:hypothetical protein
MEKKYYKVVRNIKGVLQSAAQYRPYLKTYYHFGIWIEPSMKGTDLFVFDSVKSAQHTIARYSWPNVVIYECEVKNPKRTGIFFDFIHKDILIRAIKHRSNKKKYRHLVSNDVPRGTVFCSAVKLIKLVG